MEEDLFFSRIVPIGNGTAVTLIPLLVNLPHAEGGIVYSQATPYTIPFPTGIGIPFKEKGYRTIFLYGGNTGWRNLYRFVGMQGFDEVKGGEEIIKELSLPGTMPAGNFWGIYDEYLFRYLWNLLTTAKTPLFVFLLTTTNHPPYTLPPWATPPSLFPPSPWKERIVDKKEIAEKRLKSFWYQGDSFGKFLTLLKSSPLREKVVVAATGDHSIFSLFSFSEEEILLKYGTPFYLYIPRKLTTKKLDPTIPGGHINLLPTLYELTLSEGEYLSFGEPLFPEKDPVGIGEGPLITGKEGVIFRVGKKKEFFRWKDRSSYLLTPHPWDSSAEKLWRKFQSIYLASYLFRESVRSEKGQPFATTTIKRR
jgi:phosphoglycerol transferase MdoB-like AlkP superfamily enzyme